MSFKTTEAENGENEHLKLMIMYHLSTLEKADFAFNIYLCVLLLAPVLIFSILITETHWYDLL